MTENIKFKITEKYESGGGAKLPIDYEDPKQVIHRPSINDIELIGNKTGEELGLADSSQITNINERIDAIEGDVSKIPTLENDVETAKTDIQTLGNTVDELSETVNSFDGDITQLKSDVSNHADAIASLDETVAGHTTAIENNAIDISELEIAKADKTYVDTQIASEVTNRENADNNLQEQIDAIVSSSDVKDIVGTYQDLQNYDTSTLGENDIVKVLNDSTHDNSMSYYRWDLTSWVYVGSEGPYYTKSESDSRYVPVTRTVNGKALSTNIDLNATDVGAQDILVSGDNIKTVNNQSLLGAGNIDISDVFVATYGTTNFADIETAITNGKVVVVKGFNQHNQGEVYVVSVFTKLDNVMIYLTCVESGMSSVVFYGTDTDWHVVRRELQERLVSGRNIKTINNQVLVGAGNVELQEPLVSGTNIKTINNESLLGSGNIDIDNTFVAVYNETSFDDINQAYNDKKQLFVNYNGQIRYVNVLKNSNMQYWLYFLTGNTHLQRTRYMVTKSGSSTIWNIDVSYYANVDNVYTKTEIDTYLNAKQDTLVSGTNIKTINNQSLLGSGNIDIQGGGTVDTQMSDSSENAVQNKVIKSYVDDNASKIDKIKVNGTEQTITNKEVDLEVPLVVTLAGRDETDSIVDILNNTANNQSGVIFSVVDDTVGFSLHNRAGIETQSKVLATTEHVDTKLANKQDKLTAGTGIQIVNNVINAEGVQMEVGVEKWYGTWRDGGVMYQVYTKTIFVDALPSTAGITTYDHGISGIKQILGVFGFGTNGFVLNAPRQTASDNISIYQVSKSSTNQTFSIEVGKNRSNMGAYVTLIYAKNN